jgi:hypothetical protein
MISKARLMAGPLYGLKMTRLKVDRQRRRRLPGETSAQLAASRCLHKLAECSLLHKLPQDIFYCR